MFYVEPQFPWLDNQRQTRTAIPYVFQNLVQAIDCAICIGIGPEFFGGTAFAYRGPTLQKQKRGEFLRLRIPDFDAASAPKSGELA
jgi:hypothetical protein